MTEIFPFIGTRFNSQLISNFDKVFCPPCDEMTQEERQKFHDSHENNVVRLEMPLETSEDDAFSNKFTRATNILGTWRSDGILIEDERPTFYVYEQEYTNDVGEKKSRLGFFAKVRLNDSEHKSTHLFQAAGDSALKERYQLLSSLKSNCSPIWAVYDDENGKIAEVLNCRPQEKPWEEIRDDHGNAHRLWIVQKKELLLSLMEEFKSKELYVLDGHHRYQSALEYRDHMREQTGKKDGRQPFDYTLFYLTPDSDDYTFKQYHRGFSKAFVSEFNMDEVIEELEDFFDISKKKLDLTDSHSAAGLILTEISQQNNNNSRFGILMPTGIFYTVTLRDDIDTGELIYDDMDEIVRNADCTILHNYIVNQVMIGNPEYELPDDDCWYFSDPVNLIEKIKTKKVHMGVIMRSISREDMRGVFHSASVLPVKTAYVNPRPLTGLVVRNLQSDQKKTRKS